MDRNYGKVKGTSSYFKLPLSEGKNDVFKVQWNGMDPYAKHRYLIEKHKANQRKISDIDLLKKHHKFLYDQEPSTWEDQLAFKYHQKLFKEYALCSLKLYRKGQIALRWRTEKEVLDGKGQFYCGSLECAARSNLKSWEVPFSYKEDEDKKTALVKLVLCEECSSKLNYRKRHEQKEADDCDEPQQKKMKKSPLEDDDLDSYLEDLFH